MASFDKMANRREIVKENIAEFLETQGFDVVSEKTMVNGVSDHEYEVTVYVNAHTFVDVHRRGAGNVSISKTFKTEKMAIKTSEEVKRFIIAAIKFIVKEDM